MVGLPIAIGALLYAAAQFRLARKAGSAAALIAMGEAFRQNWIAFLRSPDEPSRAFAFADLANALEIACSAYRDNVFYGHSGEVFRAYLVSVFRIIQNSEQARNRLVALLQNPKTFINITEFLNANKLEISIPPQQK